MGKKNTCIGASCGGSSRPGREIETQPSGGSGVTRTRRVATTTVGTTSTKAPPLSEMCGPSGTVGTGGSTVTGATSELTLPWPPSVNTYWRAFQGRVIISAEGRSYRKAVADQVLLQGGAKHYSGRLVVQIEVWRPDNRRRDLDNLFKAPLDACTHAGVWVDDSQIVDLRIYWATEKGGIMKVRVTEL